MKIVMKLFLLLFCLGIFSTATQATTKIWEFALLLDDKPIGNHQFSVMQSGDKTIVDINAAFDVKFLFFNAYQYRHSNKEVWENGCLLSINSSTDDNGTSYQVSGELINDQFQVSSKQGSEFHDPCVQSYYYWNPMILKQTRLLNSQTGEYETVEVKPRGMQKINIAGREVDAKHYQLITKKFQIDLWYSTQGEWLSLRSTTESGNILNYQLKELVQ